MSVIKEIVMIGELYAVRRTEKTFFRTKVHYLNLNRRDLIWETGDYSNFRICLTNDLKEIRKAFAECCGEPGRPYDGTDIISVRDFSKITELAKSDEGLADLLKQLKEFYILKEKKS
jgi:hypothetical protein